MALRFVFRPPQTWMDLREWVQWLNTYLIPHVDLADRVKTDDSTVANTTTETTVFTGTVQSGQLTVGKVVKTRILGRYSTGNGTDTFTARLKIGGATIISLTADAGNVSDAPFDVEFFFTVRSVGASGTVQAFAAAEINNAGKAADSTAVSTVDTTVNEDITCTIAWSAADPDNSVTVDQGWTEYLGV